jgi:UTP-glucose-1-phosphate uridylyltransferase
MPCDHIFDNSEFIISSMKSINYLDNSIVTFGIKPDKPEIGYGYIKIGTNNNTEKFVEKPPVDKVSPHGLIVGGMRYVFTADIWKHLEGQREGRDGEIWLSDAANSLAQKKPFFAYEYEGLYLDTGTPEALLKATIHFAKKQGLLA